MAAKGAPEDQYGKQMMQQALTSRQPQVTTLDKKGKDGVKLKSQVPTKSANGPAKPATRSFNEKSEEYKQEIERLWAIIRDPNTSEERRAAIINNLDDEIITDMRTMKNVYNKPVFVGDKYRVLTFSAHNMTMKYAERFAVTSFVAFMFKMAQEDEPEEAQNYPSENEPRFVQLYQQKIQDYEREKPSRDLQVEWDQLKAQISELETQLKSPGQSQDAEVQAQVQAKREKLAELVKRTFILRATMIKYQQFYQTKDLTSLNDSLTALNRELENAKHELNVATRQAEVAQIKLTKRKLFEEGRTDEIERMEQEKFAEHKATIARLAAEASAQGAQKEGNRLNISKLPPEVQAMHARMIEETLNADEVKPDSKDDQGRLIKGGTVERFANRLAKAEQRLAKAQAEHTKISARHAHAIEKFNSMEEKNETLREKFNSLREEYDSRYRRAVDRIRQKTAELTTGSKKHPFDEIEIERYELKEAEYDALTQETKKELGIAKTAEEYTDEHRAQIEKFLLKYLKYDPTNHVSCSYSPSYGPKEKRPRTGADIEKLRKEVEVQYGRSIVPPDDTFYRFRRYYENHYEALRQATDDIYDEASDFEFAIVPYEVFEGEDPKKVDEEVKQFQRKFADEVEADILAVRFGNWSLLDSWEENRKARDFYSAKTEIIRRIIQKNEEDAKIGDKINRQRQEKKKRENVEKHGPDAPGLDQVKKSTGPTLQKLGAKPHVMGQEIAKDHGISGKDEIEVGVTHLAPAVIGRRIRTRPDGWKFHIPSEPLKPEQIKMSGPAEHLKMLAEKEARGEDI